MFVEKYCKLSYSMEEVIVSFQRGGGTVRFLFAVNVVILIIFFCSFHNDTSVVVWIPKTVGIINVYYLEKLGMFLFHFDEGDLYEIFRRRSTFS